MAIPANQPGPSNAYMIYDPIIVFSIVCSLVVGLRIWSRLRKGGRLGPDDYCILVSLAFSYASSGVMIASCQYGFGQHFRNLTRENKTEALKYFYICQITYKASINLTKCSILLLYIRIFNSTRWFKWVCWFLIFCVGGYAVGSVLATIFQCSPIRKAFYKPAVGHCIDEGKFWYANASFSIATDVIILILPMPLVYKLKIPVAQKIALVMVFGVGSFVIIASCLRMTTIDLTAKTSDSTFDIASTMWTMIEMNLAITCACLPMVRPLVVKMFPRLLPKSSSGRKYPYGYNGQTGPGSKFATNGYISSHSQDGGEPGEWTRIDVKDGINLTTIRKGDQGSEEYILQDDPSSQQQPPGGVVSEHDTEPSSSRQVNGLGIQKTVQYSIEYS